MVFFFFFDLKETYKDERQKVGSTLPISIGGHFLDFSGGWGVLEVVGVELQNMCRDSAMVKGADLLK